MRGDAFFFIARFTTQFVISWNGTVTGEDLHLTEDRFVSETRLVCRSRGEKSSKASSPTLTVFIHTVLNNKKTYSKRFSGQGFQALFGASLPRCLRHLASFPWSQKTAPVLEGRKKVNFQQCCKINNKNNYEADSKR